MRSPPCPTSNDSQLPTTTWPGCPTQRSRPSSAAVPTPHVGLTPTASPACGGPNDAPPQGRRSPMTSDDMANDVTNALVAAVPDATNHLRALHARLAGE